ncbi:MAG: hypothetical protein ACHQF2_02440 [Flavobacteriales bacterium]
MKKLYAVFVLYLCIQTSNAQFGFNSYYQFSTSAMPQLKIANGCGIDMFSSIKKSKYSLGISYSMGVYGYKHEPLEFITSDGTTLSTFIDVTNSFQNVSFYQRYSFGTFSGILRPFIDARLGWNFFRTVLVIEDPEDESSCEALVKDVLHNSNNWAVYGGGGVDVKLNGLIFKDNYIEGNSGCYFTLTFGYALGGTVSYMNVDGNAIVSGPHNGTHQHDTEGNTTITPYYTPFINTQTQVVHEHHTGYVYTSPVRMFQVSAGFTLKF